MGIKAKLVEVNDHGRRYQALTFNCPGCASQSSTGHGYHMIPVNTDEVSPSWKWDGNLEAPTLEPSILTRLGNNTTCHSFLRNGMFEFLGDCSHEFALTKQPMLDLPEWALED